MVEPERPGRRAALWVKGWGVSAGLLVLALFPRLNAVWRGFITPDEPIWVFRAFRFMQALEAHRWPDTFQIGHPGVLTMWMGLLGIWWRRWRSPSDAAAQLGWADRVAWVTPDNIALFDRLAPFLPPSRLAMAVLTSLGVVGVYWLSRRLWDRRVALAGAALIALDPFVAGLSGLLHVDAPATTFMLLSLLAWLNALRSSLREAERGFWGKPGFLGTLLFAFFSGLCAGLGMLSKSPAIWIAGAVGLSSLLYLALTPPLSWRRVGDVALLGAVWLGGATAGLLTFPAMWNDPLGVIRAIYGLAGRHLDVAHRISFFRGVVGGDPGPWFYPTVLLYRLTPIALAGLIFSWVPLLGRGRTPEARWRRVSLASLWVFSIGFMAFVTVGAKKFDRYLLPVFPALDLLAAAGWLFVVRWLYGRPASGREGGHRDAFATTKSGGHRDARATVDAGVSPGPIGAASNSVGSASPSRAGRQENNDIPLLPRATFRSALTLLVILQGLTILPGWPYYLAAYNPLTGGLGAALRTLPVGWGEGTEQVAAYLRGISAETTDRSEHVIATGSPVTLAPLVDDDVLILDEASRRLVDHVLIAATDLQIDPEHVAALISGSELAYTARIAGHGVFWLYDTDDRAEAEHLARYGGPGDLVLCDAPSPFARRSRADRVAAEGAVGPCQVVADADESEIVDLLNGWSARHSRLWYVAYTPRDNVPVASPIVADALRRQLETYAARLDHVDLGYVTATLYILPDEPRFQVAEDGSVSARFGDQLAVTGGVLLEQPVAADGAIRFRLRWEALSAPQADYTPFVHLLDEAGHLRKAGRGEELLVDRRYWPTSYWADGVSVEREYTMGLPDGLPPGRYGIAVGLADAATGQWVPVVDKQGRIAGSTAVLLAVELQPSDKPPAAETLHLAHRTTVTWEDRLRLLGYSYPSRAYVGQRVVVEVGWLGLAPLDGDYQVRFDLSTPAGKVAAQQVLPLSTYPTSRWRAAEVIHELYDLRPPAGLDGGEYTLSLVVLDENGAPLAAPTAESSAVSDGGYSLGTLSLDAQERVFELPRPPQYSLALSLGPGISMLGYDLPQTAASPGQDVPLTLYWRGEGTIDTSYTVFVHLLDGEGRVRGQQDRIPGRGRAPTSGWVEGQIVIDEYAVPLDEDAPPGTYRIEVGMYNAKDMVRLPIVDASQGRLPEDRVLLGQEVRVE